jgi:hypothetical protein
MKAAVLAIVVSCGLLGCGGVAEKPSRGTALGQAVLQRTFSDTTVDGYKVGANFRVYRAAHVNALPGLPYDRRSSLACAVGKADAAVPVAFTLTNATAHTSVGFGADIGIDSEPVLDLSRIKFDAMVGKTPRCFTTTAANAVLYEALWDRPHAPGESQSADLYVVVPGYYAAAHPGGNRAFLHALELAIFLFAKGHVPGQDRFRGAVPPNESLIRLGK